LQADKMSRYERHILLDEVGHSGQQKLANARVLVVGAGGLGCPVLQYLTAAGVGTIGIVDGDFVSESNLQRQVLYKTEDIGQPKAICAAQALKSLNADVDVQPISDFITAKNAVEIVRGYDIIVDGTDQIHTRYLLDDACFLLNKPLVYGAIYKFEGQVSVFNYQGGPSYRDLFPTPPGPQSVATCNEVGVIGVLPGIIGNMQANEVFKIMLGYGEVLAGKVWFFNAKTNATQHIQFTKRDHEERPKTLEELEQTDYISYCNPAWDSLRGYSTAEHKETHSYVKE
jgi:molybdopterin/thiamine biosynthesis adenylyltransferase